MAEMTPDRDPDLTHDGQPRCAATSKRSGQRCGRAATPGAMICATHGAKSPQARAAVRLRLSELVDPAISVLARELVSTTNKPIDRIRAAENVLDRAGYGRQIDNGNIELAKAILLNKLLALRGTPKEEPNVIEGTVIEDELL